TLPARVRRRCVRYRHFYGGDRCLDVINQRVRKAETSRKQIEIAALGTGVGFYGKARGRIKLDLLLFAMGGGDQRANIQRRIKLRLEERFGVACHARKGELLADL